MDTPLQICLLEPNPNAPFGRSGHRIAVDDKYLYCWGGYNPDVLTDDYGSPLFKELWRYNLWSKTWKLLSTHGDVPSELASHSVLKVNNHLLHFGGTGIPFGETNTNTLYDLDLSTLRWKKLKEINDDHYEGDDNVDAPNPKYGQTMTLVGEYIFVIAGTSGFTYDCDVHRFCLKTLTWKLLVPETKYVPEGRYRHEVVHYDGKLYMFGGGTGTTVENLTKVDIFEIEKQSWTKVETNHYLDPVTGQSEYPENRKCHSCTRYQRTMYLCGGMADNIKSVLWSFDLPTLQWTKLNTNLKQPVYFHSADVTPDGCLYIFGGVSRIADVRTNSLQIMWLKIPDLKLLCWNTILKMLNLDNCDMQKQTLLSLGIPSHFLETVLSSKH